MGLGHVVRCLALAEAFRRQDDGELGFLMGEGPAAREMVRRAGHDVISLGPGDPTGLLAAVRDAGADSIVFDVRDDLSRAAVQRVRDLGVQTVVVDDGSERRLAADLAFFPPVPQVTRLDWTGFTGRRYVGWEWIILRPQFRARGASRAGTPPRLLVTMGGSDPAGLTLKAVRALTLLDLDFDTDVLVGPAFADQQALEEELRGSARQVRVRRDVEDVAGLMAEADVAVASFGITAYELAAVGVPAVHLCLSEDHAESASALVAAGAARSLGVHEGVTQEALARAVQELLADPVLRRRIGDRGREVIDGKGAGRVVEHIRSGLRR
jgi:spore coat polysaccharide biosynthesis protein SpsF